MEGAPVDPDALFSQVLDSANLSLAWKQVKANKGAPGIDGITIDDFPAFARQHWERIRSQLSEGTYAPAPVRRVFIPKPDGSQRPLGVPTVLDRVIQQAIAQVLTPLYDGDFSQHSYGFWAGRNAHQAVRQVEAGWKRKRRHAVVGGLKAFFARQPTAGRQPADRLPVGRSIARQTRMPGGVGGATGAIPSPRPD
jgi:RNA-directed DNA polymerase